MDCWSEVVPGSGVWYSTRELYDALILCVANRSTRDALVEADFGHSTNVEVFAPFYARRGSTTIGASPLSTSTRCVVEAGTTKVVATFCTLDAASQTKLCVQCSLVQPPLVPTIEDTNVNALTEVSDLPREAEPDSSVARARESRLDDAVHQTEEVCGWLDQRRRMREYAWREPRL